MFAGNLDLARNDVQGAFHVFVGQWKIVIGG